MTFARQINPHSSYQFGVQRVSNFGKPGIIPFNPKIPIGMPNPNAIKKDVMSKLEKAKK
jgi:hypothetical protein